MHKIQDQLQHRSHFQDENTPSADDRVKNLRANTWAAVAATPTPQSNVLVKHHPGDGAKRSLSEISDEHPVSSRDLRVVWIKDLANKKRPFGDVTKLIIEGPLLSVAYSDTDHAICIIFQRSEHAQIFLQRNQAHVLRFGRSLLGDRVEFLEGQPYPTDDALNRMDPPINERRRLTFARAKLFTAEGVSEHNFKKDIYELVGADNVELIWLFNTGNGKPSK